MFAALHLPALPIAAALQTQPDCQRQPCAVLAMEADIADSAKSKIPLLAINRLAAGTGIGAGWPLNRALVRCPDLRLLPRDPEQEARLLGRLCQLAESLSPDLEITRADLVVIDLCRAGSHGESWRRAALPGIEIHRAAAETPDLAHLAVRHRQLDGQFLTRPVLEALPMGSLQEIALGEPFLQPLADWGLRCLGDFMKLPRPDLVARLGARAGHWHAILHGECRLLRLHRPPESLAQSFEPEEAIGNLDALSFLLKRLLHALSARLHARHLAASSLSLILRLDGSGIWQRKIRLPEARSDAADLLRPLLTVLDGLVLESPVTGIELDVEPAAPGVSQREWLGRQLPQPDRWPETIRKLEALVGIGRVGIPVPSSSHRPDASLLRPVPLIFDENSPPPSSMPCQTPSTALPLRRFRPPAEVVVTTDPARSPALPLAILSGPHRGRITRHEGPFPSSGNWWQDGWQRLEWDIELESRHLLRLSFLPPNRWLLEGSYG
ncbi:MAG: hypothetical protein MUF31_01215 [Akkermansiaceae bacterium]|nr:hypothetical protein [Akkermansiaceae bacterium]